MTDVNETQYSSIESYREAIDILDTFTTLILLSFAKHQAKVKDVIIRNFIARGIVSLKSILKLSEAGNYQDCWVLHRCLLDRLIHLVALHDKNEFEIFEKWSFKQQYEYMNKVRSDTDVKDKISPDFFDEFDKKKDKYAIISKEQPCWSRPKAEEIAKKMNLMFLYKYGYDYASSFVHPMANDGDNDFLRQTKLGKERWPEDSLLVINNSCAVMILLIKEGLTYSSFLWRGIIGRFLEDYLSFLTSGANDYLSTFLTIGKLGPDVDLCKNKE